MAAGGPGGLEEWSRRMANIDNSRFENAYADSIKHLFATMLASTVRVAPPAAHEPRKSRFDVSCVIGVSGEVTGLMVLGMDGLTARKLISRLAGAPMTLEHEDFIDAAGELANLIAGNAKGRFGIDGVSISCPSVIVNPGHMIFRPSGMRTVVIACESEDGPFSVEVTLQQSAAGAARKQPAASAAAR